MVTYVRSNTGRGIVFQRRISHWKALSAISKFVTQEYWSDVITYPSHVCRGGILWLTAVIVGKSSTSRTLSLWLLVSSSMLKQRAEQRNQIIIKSEWICWIPGLFLHLNVLRPGPDHWTYVTRQRSSCRLSLCNRYDLLLKPYVW